MAKKGTNADVGELSVSVSADTQQFDQAMDTSAKKADGFANTIKAGTKPLRDMKQALSGIVTTAGFAVGALLAIKQAIEAIGDYIDQVWGDGAKKADDFIQSIGGINVVNATKNLEALKEQIAAVGTQLAYAQERSLFNIAGASEGTLQAQLDALKQTKATADAMIAAERDRKAAAEKKAALDAEIRKFDAAWQEEEARAFIDRWKAEEDAHAATLKRIEEEKEARKKAAEEEIAQRIRADEAAKKSAESAMKAIDDIRKAQSSVFDANRLEIHFSRISQLLGIIAAQRGNGRGIIR